MERVRNANGARSERKWNAYGTQMIERVRNANERERSVRLFLSSIVSIGVPVKKNWGGRHIFARRILKFPDGSKMNQNIVA